MEGDGSGSQTSHNERSFMGMPRLLGGGSRDRSSSSQGSCRLKGSRARSVESKIRRRLGPRINLHKALERSKSKRQGSRSSRRFRK
jgi:hypothetical protein